MIEFWVAILDKVFPPTHVAAKLSLVGMITITGWALVHAGDQRVEQATVSLTLQVIQQDIAESKEQQKEILKEVKELNKKIDDLALDVARNESKKSLTKGVK